MIGAAYNGTDNGAVPNTTTAPTTTNIEFCYVRNEAPDEPALKSKALRKIEMADRDALRATHREQHGGRLPFSKPQMRTSIPQCRARSNPR